MRVCLLLGLLIACSPCVAQSGGDSALSPPPCEAVDAPDIAEYRGRRLVEIPDVRSPEMRRANLVLSSGCYAQAFAMINEYLARRAPDTDAYYVLARWVWITRGFADAEQTILQMITEFPAFVSTRVLLAGLRIGQNRIDEAEAILDAAEVEAPDDLWIFVDRLRIRGRSAPSHELRRTYLEIVRDDRFPPNVRDTLADELREMEGVTNEEVDATYRAQISYATGLVACTLERYAFWLMEHEQRFDDARAALEEHMVDSTQCGSVAYLRMQLAYGYLVAAAELSPEPGPINADLRQRADELLGGSYIRLATYLLGRRQEVRLRPFVAAKVDPAETNRYGRTLICSALEILHEDAVAFELERGADPNGRCNGDVLLRSLGATRSNSLDPQRARIRRWLVQYGGRWRDEERNRNTGAWAAGPEPRPSA
jgi:tetratricopeptide (TPR) repeat protein